MTDVRILTEPLGGSPLSQLLQRGEAPDWCAVAPKGADAWRKLAAQRAAQADWKQMWSTLAPALGAVGAAKERLARVQREGGVVVTTGQQPGLFGGPIYTWSKAMTALALADAIESQVGIACAPVFWAATDDADFDEASFTVLATVGGSEVLSQEDAPVAGTPMSAAELGDLSSHLARLRAASGSVADARALAAAESAYANGTVGSAYVELLRVLLAPLGVAVLDASHEAVRSASDPILRRSLECAPVVEQALRARRMQIEGKGLDPQVDDVRGLSLVFVREDGIKRRVSVDEANALAHESNAHLTPNVLLRPIVEASILPTVAYLGGPGEVAYFAQVSAVADALGAPRPVVLPRWSCTLIEPHVQALLEKFSIDPHALARPYELESQLARDAMSEQSRQGLASLRSVVENAGAEIAAEARELGIEGALTGAQNNLLHRVDRLERRLTAAIKRREHAQLRDVATLRAALYPGGKRQERALNLLPMLARNGLELLNDMRAAAGPHVSTLVGG